MSWRLRGTLGPLKFDFFCYVRFLAALSHVFAAAAALWFAFV
jgi:hypothetical protein